MDKFDTIMVSYQYHNGLSGNQTFPKTASLLAVKQFINQSKHNWLSYSTFQYDSNEYPVVKILHPITL